MNKINNNRRRFAKWAVILWLAGGSQAEAATCTLNVGGGSISPDNKVYLYTDANGLASVMFTATHDDDLEKTDPECAYDSEMTWSLAPYEYDDLEDPVDPYSIITEHFGDQTEFKCFLSPGEYQLTGAYRAWNCNGSCAKSQVVSIFVIDAKITGPEKIKALETKQITTYQSVEGGTWQDWKVTPDANYTVVRNGPQMKGVSDFGSERDRTISATYVLLVQREGDHTFEVPSQFTVKCGQYGSISGRILDPNGNPIINDGSRSILITVRNTLNKGLGEGSFGPGQNGAERSDFKSTEQIRSGPVNIIIECYSQSPAPDLLGNKWVEVEPGAETTNIDVWLHEWPQ